MVKCISDSCYPGHFLKLRLETALFLHISFNGQNWMKFNYQKNSLWVSILHVLLLFEFGVLLTHSQVIVLSGSIVLVCSHNCEIVSWMQDETNVPAEHLQAVGGGKIEVGLLLISCQTFFCFVSFPLRFRDGQKTYHLLPVRQIPPTFPLFTSCLSKWIVKTEL